MTGSRGAEGWGLSYKFAIFRTSLLSEVLIGNVLGDKRYTKCTYPHITHTDQNYKISLWMNSQLRFVL